MERHCMCGAVTISITDGDRDKDISITCKDCWRYEGIFLDDEPEDLDLILHEAQIERECEMLSEVERQ